MWAVGTVHCSQIYWITRLYRTTQLKCEHCACVCVCEREELLVFVAGGTS